MIDPRSTRAYKLEKENRELKKRIREALEYYDNCIDNMLDISIFDERTKELYELAYTIHINYKDILQGADK